MNRHDAARAAASMAARRIGRGLGLKLAGIALVLFFGGIIVSAPIITVAAGAAGGGGGAAPEIPTLPIDGNKQELAAALMASGKLRTLPNNPDHIFEIRDIAAGTIRPNCDIDVRVLQILTLLVQRYDSVGVSDINRHCTGQIEGAGTNSAHWRAGGGHAVDLWALNGRALTGGDALSLDAITYLDPHMPPGARVGQIQCRGSLDLKNLKPFEDTCNHVHLDVLYAAGGIS